jgi:hypothetical protein
MPTRDISTFEFLNAIFAGLDGYVEFRLIGKGITDQLFVSVPDVLRSYTEVVEPRLRKVNMGNTAMNLNRANIYFGVNPRTEKIGDAAHVKTCRVLWADLDYTEKEYIEKNATVLKALGLYPNIIIHSGHGWHFYWMLVEQVDPEEAGKVMKTISRVLASDPKVTDAPRIMRLPNFWNVKANPLMCRVAHFDLSRLRNLSDFEPLETVAPGEVPPSLAHKMKKESVVVKDDGDRTIIGLVARAIIPFWKSGARHALAIGLAGLLRKDGISKDEATLIMRKIAAATKDDEVDDRTRAVDDTYSKPINEVSASSVIFETLQDDGKEFLKSYNSAVRAIPPEPVERIISPDFNLYECVPSGSIIDKHVHYAASKTDAPVQYHAASIITICAAALGNRTFLEFHGKKLFPTMYTMICGPSTRFRKSTSIGLAADLSFESEIENFSENSTPEQMYARMAPEECEWREDGKKRIPVAWRGSPQGLITHAEFTQFLEASTKGYMSDARSLMMHLYDGTRATRETKTHGRYYIESPAVSMLCGVTLSAIKSFCSKTDAGSGFLSRFFVVMPPRKHTNRFGLDTPDQAMVELRKDVAERVHLMSVYKHADQPVPVTFDAQDVLIEFEEWINEKIKKVEYTAMAILDSFYARLATTAYKIALIYSATRQIPINAVEKEDAEMAVGFCRWAARNLDSFYTDTRSNDGNREAGYAEQVLVAARGISIRSGGKIPVPHRELFRQCNLDANQFRNAIHTLLESQRLLLGPASAKGGKTYTLNEVERVG